MRRLLITILLSLATPTGFAWSACGVVIVLPSGWNADVVAQDKSVCETGARPGNWQELEAKSRWSEEPYALNLKVFKTSFRAAGGRMGFERDERGEWGVPGRQGDMSKAEPVKIGAFSGWRSEPWFRGFAKDGAELGDQSRLYSGTRVVLLLHDRHGTVIGVEYNQWSPDIDLDRDAAAESIVRSLRRAAPNSSLERTFARSSASLAPGSCTAGESRSTRSLGT